MKKLSILVFMLFYCQVGFAETVESEKVALIDQILEQTGQSAVQIGTQFSDAFIQQTTMVLKKSQKDIDERVFAIIEDEVKLIIKQEIVEKNGLAKIAHPIYSKHFTTEELKQMIELNNTPFGKKVLRVMPLITQESMKAGQELGQSIAPKIQSRIAARFEKEGIK